MRVVVRPAVIVVALAGVALTSAAAVYGVTTGAARWSAEERTLLRSLSLQSLGPVPADPSNRYADDSAAARLGHQLFFDTRLSSTGKVACSTCHLPGQDFQDGIPLGRGVGTATRRTMPIAGTAYSAWQFWDGRADSHWAQALGPLESAVEHGGTRTQYAHLVASAYRDEYERVFGALPALTGLPREAGPVEDTARAAAWGRITAVRRDEITRIYANIGKAIAAYERGIGFAPSRFDRYVDAEIAGRTHSPESALTRDEEAGLRLFIGKASCVNCHNGSLLTDNQFHNTGVARPSTPLPNDDGRATGVRQVLASEFNCLGKYSDAKAEDCEELRFTVSEGEELVRAYKTPSLRNVAARAPYMHAGQIASLAEVVAHYDRAPDAPAGHSELKRLRLSAIERRQIEAFLRTLTSPLSAPAGHLAPPATTTGGSVNAVRRSSPR